MKRAIWWIRRDLRLADNQALHAALRAADEVLPLFIWDHAILSSDWYGEKRHAFLNGGLRALDDELRTRGSRLIIRSGPPLAVLQSLCENHSVSQVFAERDLTPYAKGRDQLVGAALPLALQDGITARPVIDVRQSNGKTYTVFTPFSRAWKTLGAIRYDALLPEPEQVATPATVESEALPDSPSLPGEAPFTPGEVEARRRLWAFTAGKDAPVFRYGEERNRLDLTTTSRLSPYFRFGMISARQAVAAAYKAMQHAPDAAAQKGAETWLNELIWREFYIMIMAAFPRLRRGSFRAKYETIRWANDERDFAAWCEGRTGYPIVDAAMRQLRVAGWLHNRLRMIVASFLVKDLLIDWRWGERWFMQQLVDGDPAANSGGWQWTAGVGTDAAPYFRIFNPVTQGEKFDPAGDYVRAWLPELARVPSGHIHQPWQMTTNEQRQARCRIGEDYPAPIIDHAWARERVLAAFKAL